MIARIARSMRRRARLFYHSAQAGMGAFRVDEGELTIALGATGADAMTEVLRAKQFWFFFSLSERSALGGRFAETYSEAAKSVIIAADEVCRHRFRLLSAETLAADDPIDWRMDYVAGRRWKKRYSALLPVQYDDESDIKRVWELSRCQYFAAIGVAHVLTEFSHRKHGGLRLQENATASSETARSETSVASAAKRHRDCLPKNGRPARARASLSESSTPSVAESPYAAEFVAEILDWDKENPPLIGPNWISPMEAAIRIVNWIWGYAFMGGSPAFDENVRKVFYRNLLSHGRFILRNLEPYGNHRFSNFVGLVWLGVLFPEFKEAAEWREVGLKGFNDELGKQVRADGCHFEGSIPYHRLVLEMAATTWLLLRRKGIELPAESQTAIARMFEFTAAYLGRSGLAPQVGDADDGRLQEFLPLDKRDHSYLLSLAAVLTGRPEFKLTEKPHPEAYWLLGEQGLQEYDSLRAACALRRQDALAAPPAQRPLAPAAVARGPASIGGSDQADDEGRQGRPSGPRTEPGANGRPSVSICGSNRSAAFPESGFYVLASEKLHVFVSCRHPHPLDVGAHGHNDHLSFTLAFDGVEFIVDLGTYTYTGNLQERDQFRSTAAHNTIMADGEEINPLPRNDPFRLKDKANCRVTEWRSGEEEDFLTAEHEGYAPLDVHVRRTFRLDRRAEILCITDSFAGSGVHELIWRFHFAPEAKVELTGRELVASRGGRSLRLSFSPIPGMNFRLCPGWYSPRYGVKEPAISLVMKTRCNLPHAFEYVLAGANSHHFVQESVNFLKG
jgi:hypothetical protein